MQAHTIALVWLCLACAGNGRRVQKAPQQSADHPDKALNSIAALLQAHNQAPAFQTTGMQTSRGLPVRNRAVNSAGLQSPRLARSVSMMAEETAEKVEEPPADKKAPEDCDTCSIDNLSACSPEELEILYVDALWSYYADKKQILSDEQYSKLVAELNWQGSGFPSLRRNEIAFVKAALAFAKGETIVSDEKWDEMKAEIKASTGKRKEVTEFLLYTRSLRETAATRERLFEEMAKSGIGISVTASGVSCTLSNVPNTLTPNVKDVFEMYLALSAVPTFLALLGWVIVALILQGPEGIIDTAIPGIPIAGFVSAFISTNLIKYVELAQPELLEGQCPCCESKISYMSTSFNDREPKISCANCKTDLVLNCDQREIGKAGGLNVISADDGEEATKGKWTDDILSRDLLKGISDITLGQPNEETQLYGPGKSEKVVIPKDMTKLRYIQENFFEGLYAPAVLIGYAIFGEQFVIRARGKLIQLHSQAINSFASRYAIPPKMKKVYVETAKRNGEDLGMLVTPPKLFGDGIVGKQAMAWWKSAGF